MRALELSAPPPSDILGPAARGLQLHQYVARRLDAYAVRVVILGPVAIAAFAFLLAFGVEGFCPGACGFAWSLLLTPALYASFGLFLTALAYAWTRRSRRRARREPAHVQSFRLQSVKDWFARGDLSEAEFDQLRTRIQPLIDGNAPSLKAIEAALFLRRGTLLLALAFPLLTFVGLISTVAVAEIGEPFTIPLALIGLLAAFTCLVATGFGFHRARLLHQAATRLEQQTLTELDELERGLMRVSNQRRGGQPAVANPTSASYRPYLRR